MAENVLMLLAATIVIFIIARCMKDAKAFAKFMAILAFGLIVGTGVKSAVEHTADAPEKTVVVSTESIPMHSNTSPFVLENVDANLDCASKDTMDCDTVATGAEGLPTMRVESDIIDDS